MVRGGVAGGGGRHAERPESLVAREVQEVEQRQARRPIDDADHPLSPPVGARVVDGPGGAVLLGWKEHLRYQREVLAEGEAALEPARCIGQGDAPRCSRQGELAHVHRLGRAPQVPEVQLVPRNIGLARRHVGRFRRSRASMDAVERTARRRAASPMSRSSAPRSIAGSASAPRASTRPTIHRAVATMPSPTPGSPRSRRMSVGTETPSRRAHARCDSRRRTRAMARCSPSCWSALPTTGGSWARATEPFDMR